MKTGNVSIPGMCAWLGLALTLISLPQEPQRTGTAPGEMDPFSVTLFREADYRVPIGTWKLAPGQRLARLPDVRPVPRSLLVGEKTGVLIFPGRDFSSTQTAWDPQSQKPTEMDAYLVPYFRFRNSAAQMFPGGDGQKLVGGIGGQVKTMWVAPQAECSIVIHRRDLDDILGVFLESVNPASPFKKFFPLADRAAQAAIVYNAIPTPGPFLLTVIAGGSGQMSLFPSQSPPNPNNLRVTIETPYQTVEFPEKNADTARFDLRALGVMGEISRMKLRYLGPVHEAAYSEPESHRAPAAPPVQAQVLQPVPGPAAPPPSLAGTWQSNIGAEYLFTATPSGYSWTAPSLGQQGTITVNGPAITTHWSGPGGSGSVNGQITETGPTGIPLRIEWENGVAIFRPSLPAVPSLAGDWKGFLGLTFTFTQNGSQFSWSVKTTGEKAQGTIDGDNLSVSWTNPLGSGSAKGKITAKDPSGRATRIQWDNGVVFKR